MILLCTKRELLLCSVAFVNQGEPLLVFKD